MSYKNGKFLSICVGESDRVAKNTVIQLYCICNTVHIKYSMGLYFEAIKAWVRFKPPCVTGPMKIYFTSLWNEKDDRERIG